MVPKVDYRFGDIWAITDFINPRLDKAFDSEGDRLVIGVANFIRDEFQYPFLHGMPSTDGKLKRFHKSLWQYHFSKYVLYMWSFPQETLIIRQGICVDTSTLATSLLVPKLDAWCCLGEVRKTDDTLIGYHAWTVVPYKGEEHLMETTVHTRGTDILLKTKEAYDKNSAWAIIAGLYYVEKARFNDRAFMGEPDIVTLMRYPAKRVLLFGLEKTKCASNKTIYKEWRLEEKIKMRLLKEAYR